VLGEYFLRGSENTSSAIQLLAKKIKTVYPKDLRIENHLIRLLKLSSLYKSGEITEFVQAS